MHFQEKVLSQLYSKKFFQYKYKINIFHIVEENIR